MADMPGMSTSKDGSVRLTELEVRQFGVTFDTVKLRALNAQVRAPITIAVDETRISQITPKFSGFIERLFVNATGQVVQRGQPVAAIFSPELVAAQEELLLAIQLEKSASTDVPGGGTPRLRSAAVQRLRLWGISDSEIQEIEKTGKAKRTLTITSPASGIVTEKLAVQGQSVMAGAPMLTIADLSTVWGIGELREADAAIATPGTAATIAMTAYPGAPVSGRVSYIYPTLQAEGRTIRVRISLPNPGMRLKPGMFGTATLITAGSTALTVPVSAVIETGKKSVLFVRMPDGSLMPHEITEGRRVSDFVEVLSGVNAGQVVVTSAQFLLESESNIAEVMRSMIGQQMPAAAGR
jgi:Cu(I)/Ag(I) efflux system membrane fusion protein